MPSSTYYERKKKSQRIDGKRLRERAQVSELFHASRGSAGSRTLVRQLLMLDIIMGRYKVSRLMQEAGLRSKRIRIWCYAPWTWLTHSVAGQKVCYSIPIRAVSTPA